MIQLESPYTVASFLQRLGRTGRRAGSSGNCLFLAVTPDGFLRALGLLHLWRQGYVEPITPPAKPFHVLVQQLLALILQENSVGHHTWQEWLGAFLRISGIMHEESEQLIDYMLTQGFLWEDNGILGIGSESEKRFGGKNYLTLFTVFLAPPLFMVLYGRVELGQVHPISFVAGDKQPITLALAGKFWAVKWIDWNNRRVYVDPSEQKGRSRWLGTHVQGLHFHLCRAIPLALLSHDKSEYLSQRARTMAEELCDDWAWLDERDGTWLVLDDSGVVWWNFAGYALNSASAKELRPQYPDLKASEFCLSFPQQTDFQQIKQAILAIPADLKPHIDEQAAESLKFSECLPALLLASLLLHRFKDDVPAQNNWRQELFLVKTKKILAI